MRGVLALLLTGLVLTAPLVPVARAAALPGASTNEIPGLKRTNQVLAVLIALLKLIDEIGQMPDPGHIAPMPPPIGTGHPGPGPGPLPVIAPDDPVAVMAAAG